MWYSRGVAEGGVGAERVLRGPVFTSVHHVHAHSGM